MLQQKNKYNNRIRLALTTDFSTPAGAGLEFYRAKALCNHNIAAAKKRSLTISYFDESLFIPEFRNLQGYNWSGGQRVSAVIRYHIPMPLSLYFGFGYEGGTRILDGISQFNHDATGNIGFEFKFFNKMLTKKAILGTNIFVEAKGNYCLTNNFYYILPAFGLKFHLY